MESTKNTETAEKNKKLSAIEFCQSLGFNISTDKHNVFFWKSWHKRQVVIFKDNTCVKFRKIIKKYGITHILRTNQRDPNNPSYVLRYMDFYTVLQLMCSPEALKTISVMAIVEDIAIQYNEYQQNFIFNSLEKLQDRVDLLQQEFLALTVNCQKNHTNGYVTMSPIAEPIYESLDLGLSSVPSSKNNLGVISTATKNKNVLSQPLLPPMRPNRTPKASKKYITQVSTGSINHKLPVVVESKKSIVLSPLPTPPVPLKTVSSSEYFFKNVPLSKNSYAKPQGVTTYKVLYKKIDGDTSLSATNNNSLCPSDILDVNPIYMNVDDNNTLNEISNCNNNIYNNINNSTSSSHLSISSNNLCVPTSDKSHSTSLLAIDTGVLVSDWYPCCVARFECCTPKKVSVYSNTGVI